ncbi:MAG: MASE3 domain-containing protein, partial [Spirochaetota bacterium]
VDNKQKIMRRAAVLVMGGAAIIALYIVQLDHYLLFHSLTEIFSIVIAFSIFLIAWNGRQYLRNNFLLLLGVAYLYIAFLDILHTLGYPGLGVFREYNYYSNQVWIAARILESVSLLLAVSLINRKLKVPFGGVFMLYALVTGGFVYSIFFSDIFPVCYVEGEGQTTFKIVAEYVIIAVLAASLALTVYHRNHMSRDTYVYISWSLVFTMVSELAFTFYVSNYGFSNMVGHYAKILSFYFLYRAIVAKSLLEPYDMIFRELSQRTAELQEADRLKTTLFSIISHDLRSPFVTVSSLVHMLDSDSRIQDDPELSSYVGQVKNSTDSALLLLDNLLSWSRLQMGGGKITKNRKPLRKLVDDAAKPMKPLYDKKRIQLEIDIPEDIDIFADRDAFSIVVRNILSNALKYSFPGERVVIEVQINNGRVTLFFRDFGTGMQIVPDMYNSAFRASERGTANEKGSGLGLNLIKRYTEANNGSFRIESSPGKGTTVILTFETAV